MKSQQRSRQRSPHDSRKRRGGHEARHRTSSGPRREPILEIQNDAREETRFRRAQQKAQSIETSDARD